MLLLEVILCSLNDHPHIADLLGLVQYINSDAPSSPGKKPQSDHNFVDESDDFLLKLKISGTLMKMLLRNMGFFTVSFNKGCPDLTSIFSKFRSSGIVE